MGRGFYLPHQSHPEAWIKGAGGASHTSHSSPRGMAAAAHAGFPKSNVTSFHAESMSYSFDYASYHFIVLHQNPR